MKVGQVVEILLGYNSMTHTRDILDEIAGRMAVVLGFHGRDVLVEIDGYGEAYVNAGRCFARGEA